MSRTPTLAAAAALAFVAVPVVSAAAQRRPAQPSLEAHVPLRVGQTITDSITSRNPRMMQRGHFRVYTFNAQQDQRLVISVKSPDFDAYASVLRTIAGITEEIASNDDAGGDRPTDARVRFTVPRTGTYHLVAQPLDSAGRGRYTVTLEAVAPVVARVVPIEVGQTVNGRLDESDPSTDDDRFYDTYRLTAQAGQRLLLEMSTTDEGFDPFLFFGRMKGADFEKIAENDDAGGGLNSRLVVTVRETGEYVIRASEVGSSNGSYTLRVTSRPIDAAATRPRPIAMSTDTPGSLDEDDASEDETGYYETWTFSGRAGDRVRITMRSSEFDTFVAVGSMDGPSFRQIASNDDAEGMGTDSMLEVTLPRDGEFVIRARAFSSGSTGSYTLRMEPMGR